MLYISLPLSLLFHTKLLFTSSISSRAGLPGQQKPKSERGLSSTSATSSIAAAPALDAAYEGNDLSVVPHRALGVLSRYRALVLDSAYRPIDVVHWQRAICMDVLQKVDVLEYYDYTINSVKEQFFLPAVMRARWYGGNTTRLNRVPLSRRNIMIRDECMCQYCGSKSNLTLDHVIPQSKGGPNSWTNLVTACSPCNTKKGDKTLKQLKWKLAKQPKEPSPWELTQVLAAVGVGDVKSVPPEWASYLFQGDFSSEEE